MLVPDSEMLHVTYSPCLKHLVCHPAGTPDIELVDFIGFAQPGELLASSLTPPLLPCLKYFGKDWCGRRGVKTTRGFRVWSLGQGRGWGARFLHTSSKAALPFVVFATRRSW